LVALKSLNENFHASKVKGQAVTFTAIIQKVYLKTTTITTTTTTF